MFVDLERFSQSIVLKRKARIQHTEFDSISTNKKYIYLCIYTHLNMCILYTFQHYIACIIHNIYYIHYKHLEQKKKYQNIKSTYVCEIALLVLSNSVYICNQKTLIKLFQSRVVSHQSLQVLTSLYLQGHIYSHPPSYFRFQSYSTQVLPKNRFLWSQSLCRFFLLFLSGKHFSILSLGYSPTAGSLGFISGVFT